MAGTRSGQRWTALLVRPALLLAIAMLLVGAVGANATTVEYSADDTTLIVNGADNADHELQFRLSDDGTADEIIDSVGFSAIPATCTYVFSNTWVSCPARNHLKLDLGDGRDRVYFNGTSDQAGDCFLSYNLNLGNGFNDNTMNSACTDPATLNITAGSGDDVLSGGAAGTSSNIVAGSGRDSVNGGAGDDVIRGGEGADGVFGDVGNDQVYGEGGNDQLRGGDGNDVEDGGPGDDDIGYRGVNVISEPDPGADHVRGGDGTDLLRLDGHIGGMAISLDGQPNDGTPGEGDNIGADIEAIRGGTGNENFTGSPGADGFDGGSGDDVIHGAGGNDALAGGGGNDSVFGDAGNDKVEGSFDTDTVDGGAGTDQIYGDTAGCSVFCAPDSDLLLARDGERDTVNCGGPGTARVDELDVVAGGCTSVDRKTVAGGAPAKASFAGSKRSIDVSRKGRFSYSFRAGAGLRGKAVFRSVKKVRISKRARTTLAKKAFKINRRI